MVKYVKNSPTAREFPVNTILFYDRKVKRWASGFKYKIALNAGESLKTPAQYISVLNQVQKLVQKNQLGGSDLTFIAMGGGSVGDFVGFLASTYQRGKRFISVPTTWLAVIDSAHGGKTSLNLNGVKNQIGTFYPAQAIYICEKILAALPVKSLNDALAEALKIGLINRPKNFLALEKEPKSLLKNLPQLISGKNDIVRLDPFEKKGLRKVLNLGHTMGHVFETIHHLPHGQAIFLGMLFSLRFSLKKKYLSWDEFQFLSEKLFLIDTPLTYQQALKMPLAKVKQILAQDKKKTSKDLVDFIFVRKLGKVVIKSVRIEDLISELKRQQQEL